MPNGAHKQYIGYAKITKNSKEDENAKLFLAT